MSFTFIRHITIRKAILSVVAYFYIANTLSAQTIKINLNGGGRTFEGIGALSAGASSSLLRDYSEPYKSEVLDFLFKPYFGASLQHLKVEIGGDVNSTDGTEPSHARTREEYHNPEPEYFNRGFEWMLMEESKKRNPSIYLDCLEWGVPGWIGNGVYYSKDNANYVAAFIEGAKKYHNLNIDFTGVWNERIPDNEWIKLLRRTLDSAGLQNVKIVAGDYFNWNLAEDELKDAVLFNSVYANTTHYTERNNPPYRSSATAKSIGKPIWNSEGGPWRGDWEGFNYLSKMYNREYIIGKMTKHITWSLLTSYYDNLSLPNSGLLIAKTPWSGHYELQPALWAAAHTTQFTKPGWKYIDDGCGFNKDSSVSYVILKDTATSDISLIIESIDARQPQPLRFQFSGKLPRNTLKVWKSTNPTETFTQQKNILVKKKRLNITIEPHSLYSITTTEGQHKGEPTPAAAKPFPFPYQTGLEEDSINHPPRYFMDQGGAFEVEMRDDGKGKCLRQRLLQHGIEWESGDAFFSSILGDTAWKDYTVRCDINVRQNTGSAILIGRVSDVHRGLDFPEGYTFRVYTGGSSGRWQLYAGHDRIATGDVWYPPFEWNTLSLSFKGKTITAFINDKQVCSVENDKFSRGVAGVGSGYNITEFDNFKVSDQ